MSSPFSENSKESRKSKTAFRTISEVADELDVPQHVLRFWESRFTQIKPLKRGGGRRYYRPEDVSLLMRIRELLYHDGLTIKGVQKLFREHGVKTVIEGSTGSLPLTDVTEVTQNTVNISSIRRVITELTDLRDILRTALSSRL